MSEKKEKQENNFNGSNCVIRDDDHGWGGPEPVYEDKPKEKIKNSDEPMNWPWGKYRS